MANNTANQPADDREIISTRIFDASKEQVFKAWSTPELLAKWWGPTGFTNTFETFEFKPDGKWKFTMHGPDGGNYPNESVFREIIENERIVFHHIVNPKFLLTATFTDVDGKTRLDFKMRFDTSDDYHKVKKIVIEANEQNFDRLEVVLARISPEPEFVITRTFNAPRNLVFKAFTEAEHLRHWWGPKGFKLTVIELGVKPGGLFHYQMESAEGHQMWAKFDYVSIKVPEEIVFTNTFSDPEGNTIRPPFEDNWPYKILYVWTFAEQDGKTTLTLSGKAFNATEEERKVFEAGFPSMQEGFGGTFNQLDDYLTKIYK